MIKCYSLPIMIIIYYLLSKRQEVNAGEHVRKWKYGSVLQRVNSLFGKIDNQLKSTSRCFITVTELETSQSFSSLEDEGQCEWHKWIIAWGL